MDNVSSIIDGSMAIAGLIATLAGASWALMASKSAMTLDLKHADEALRSTLKKAA
jgi:hypothetical protein